MSAGLSVVIPALHEAQNLAELLPSLKRQSRPPDEIIIAEAGSRDRTAEVASRHGARIVAGGRPAQGRNNGARAAGGEVICFIDADTRLPDDHFFKRFVAEFASLGLAAAVTDNRPYYRPGDKGFGRPWLEVYDRVMMAILSQGQRFWLKRGFPVGQAVFLATRRDVFIDLGGFDSKAEPFEDSEYLLRLHRRLPPPRGRSSAVGVLSKGLYVEISMRRYDVKGRFFFPLSQGIKASFLRWALRRELPNPRYWELNRRGYGERHDS